MSERDTDFEFDFFEDSEPPEQTDERTRIVRRPGPSICEPVCFLRCPFSVLERRDQG